MASLVWAGVVLVLGALAYRVAMKRHDRIVDLAKRLEEAREAIVTTRGDFAATHKRVELFSKLTGDLTAQVIEAQEKLAVLDQRTDPQATGQVTPTGRQPRRIL